MRSRELFGPFKHYSIFISQNIEMLSLPVSFPVSYNKSGGRVNSQFNFVNYNGLLMR
jgi:hypothetical protein